MAKVLVILNPSSGKEEATNYVEKLKEVLNGIYQEIAVRETSESLDAEELAKTGADEGFDSIIALGGDGTVHGVVNGLMKSAAKPALGIIPMGTVNNFARNAGIPMNAEKAIELLRNAKLRTVDTAKIEDTYFISSVSAGPIPETVQQVGTDLKSAFGPIAYFIEGLKALDEKKTYSFRMVFDNKEWKQVYSLILVSLSNSVAGIENFFPDASMDDGKLYFLGLKESSAQEKLAIVPKLFQEDKDYTDKVDVISFEEAYVTIEDESSPHTTIDGETGPTFPAKIKVLPASLSIFVPEREE